MQDAHNRLDLVDAHFQALADAVEKATTGQTELAKSVSELTGAVNTLRNSTATTQESLKTFISDSDSGRVLLAKLIGDEFDKKTGSWVRWAMISAILTSPNWAPKLFEILKGGLFHG